jgi:hypothetical protein
MTNGTGVCVSGKWGCNHVEYIHTYIYIYYIYIYIYIYHIYIYDMTYMFISTSMGIYVHVSGKWGCNHVECILCCRNVECKHI